jgi:hypothetical protein
VNGGDKILTEDLYFDTMLNCHVCQKLKRIRNC